MQMQVQRLGFCYVTTPPLLLFFYLYETIMECTSTDIPINKFVHIFYSRNVAI